jgi:hypothetical protein
MSEKAKQTVGTEKVGIRRAPKYLPFILLGGIFGIGISLLIGLGSNELRGPLVAIGATVGVGLGILVALILDRVYLSRGRELDATKITE